MVDTKPAENDAQMQEIQLEILLTSGFVGTEFTAIVDTLRIANRVLGHSKFSWKCTSNLGGFVESVTGFAVRTTEFSALRDHPDVMVVPGNGPDNPIGRGTVQRLRQMSRAGGKVILLSEAAAEFISRSQDLEHPMTTHWESKSTLVEQTIGADVADTLIETHDGLTTAAGMTATIDLMLNLLADYVDLSVVRAVSAVLLHDRIRPGNTQQTAQRASVLTSSDPYLRRVIRMMEENLEGELRIRDLARETGIAARSLERKFQTAFNTTPSQFLRDLRLNKSLILLNTTDMPLIEIALSCGLGSTGQFSKLFRARYSVTPAMFRKQKMTLKTATG